VVGSRRMYPSPSSCRPRDRATFGFPYFHLGQIDAPIPIQCSDDRAAGLIIGAIPRALCGVHGVATITSAAFDLVLSPVPRRTRVIDRYQ